MVQTFHGMVRIMSNRIESMGESPRAKQAGPRGIIAFDLDGTVLANRFNSRVTPRVEAAFSAAHDIGYALTVSTGRPLIELSDELLGASWLDWAICSSGSALYRVKPYPEGLGVSSVNNIDDLRHAVPIESHTLDFEQIQGIMSLTASNVASYWADTPAGYFVEDEKMPEHLRFLLDDIQTRVNSIGDVAEVRRLGAYKVSVHFERGEDCARVQAYLDEFASLPYEIANEGETSLEFSPLGVNKGMAALSVCKITGALPEASVAFGDSGNDMSFAKTPMRFVVMDSAEPKVIASADYVCPDVFHDGVAVWLEQHILNNS